MLRPIVMSNMRMLITADLIVRAEVLVPVLWNVNDYFFLRAVIRFHRDIILRTLTI